MNLIGLDPLLRSNYSSNLTSIRDARTQVKLMGRKKLDNPSFSYFGSRNYWYNNDKFTGYQGHEYDLFEYSRIIDTEAMVAKAFERKRALIFKNGYFFESNNQDNIDYIKRRIREIEHVTGTTFRSFIEEMAYNLIMFHNAYIVLIRDENKSSGEEYNNGSKILEPIAGWFNLPTESVQRKIKPNGDISMYRQYIDGQNYRIFSPEKIRHLKYNARTGFTIGTPPLEAVKDDILALRRIEESVETLIYKGLFPMIHVKIGTESKPAGKLIDGTDEVEMMSDIMDRLDDFGGVTTSERVEIKAIGAESLALRVESYLKYFKDRVMLGLGVSDLDMGVGDSSGKATGQIVSQTLKEAVINMQDSIADFITSTLFIPLLVESGKYNVDYEIPESDIVKFTFNHVDQEAQIKIESHILNMFNSGLISINEARKEIGFKELSESDIRSIGREKEGITPTYQVEQVRLSMQTQTEQANQEANSSGNKTKSDGSKKAVAAVNNPSNQYTDSIDPKILEVDYLIQIMDNKELLNIVLSNHIKSVVDRNNIYTDNVINQISEIASSQINSIKDNDYETIKEDIEAILVSAYEPLEDIV